MAQLFIDAGQTGIRLEASATGMPAEVRTFPGVRSHEDVLIQISGVMAPMIATASLSSWDVAVGVTGLTAAHGGAERLLALSPPAVTRVALAHDSITAYLGALGDQFGTVLAVGTGVVGIACSPHATARVDGWGHLLGDAGGGFWIGAEGLRAALRSVDGRGQATALVDRAVQRFGPVDDIPRNVYESPERVSEIAAFCIDTVAAAEEGDDVAALIVRSAAMELARSASASLNAVSAPITGRKASWSGSLITSSRLVRELLETALASETHPVMLVQPNGTPLDGVRALLSLSDSHPLFTAVSRASRIRG